MSKIPPPFFFHFRQCLSRWFSVWMRITIKVQIFGHCRIFLLPCVLILKTWTGRVENLTTKDIHINQEMCFLNFSLFFQLCFSPLSFSHPGGPAWGLKCPGSVGFLFTAPATDPHHLFIFGRFWVPSYIWTPWKSRRKNRFVVDAPCLARCTHVGCFATDAAHLGFEHIFSHHCVISLLT